MQELDTTQIGIVFIAAIYLLEKTIAGVIGLWKTVNGDKANDKKPCDCCKKLDEMLKVLNERDDYDCRRVFVHRTLYSNVKDIQSKVSKIDELTMRIQSLEENCKEDRRSRHASQ